MQTAYQLPSLFDLQLELYRDETTLISKYKYAFLSKYTEKAGVMPIRIVYIV